MIAGCGSDPSAKEPGVFWEQGTYTGDIAGTEATLRQLFNATKICTESPEGQIEDLHIIIISHPVDCAYPSTGLCFGEFEPPNTIRIGQGMLWGSLARHEFIHYLLEVNTGDTDGAHSSQFFLECI